MKLSRHLLFSSALACILGLLWILLSSQSEPASEKTKQAHREHSRLWGPEDKSTARIRQASPETTSPEVTRLIERSLVRFQASGGVAESSAILQGLRERIRAIDSPAALRAIVDFLESGKDASTRLPFIVGSGGVMESVPTLRTALLDLLPALDPSVALDVARSVMDLKQSPDDYALALRNLAWNDLDGDLKDELSDRFERMIQTKDWRANPSSGFLEGLDTALQVSDEKVFRNMLILNAVAQESDRAALVRASFIALDRMVLHEPDLLVKSFASDPQLSGVSADHRASLMSRLDLLVPAQRDLFTTYVSRSQHGPGELAYFADLFPNGNHFHGNWLISSQDPSPSIQSRLQADQKILAMIDSLMTENPGDQAIQTIARIRVRLQKAIATQNKE